MGGGGARVFSAALPIIGRCQLRARARAAAKHSGAPLRLLVAACPTVGGNSMDQAGCVRERGHPLLCLSVLLGWLQSRPPTASGEEQKTPHRPAF